MTDNTNGTKKYLNMGMGELRDSVKELHTRINTSLEKINQVNMNLTEKINQEVMKMSEQLTGNSVAIENIGGLIKSQQETDKEMNISINNLNESLVELKVVSNAGKKIALVALGLIGSIAAAVATAFLGFGG